MLEIIGKGAVDDIKFFVCLFFSCDKLRTQ